MASLPPSQRPSGSQRSSPSSSSPLLSPTSQEAQQAESSATYETVLLNPPSPTSASRQSHDWSAESIQPAEAPIQDDDVKRCWICFSDETEDTPLSSSWRSPCPCALTAHESCLLDWVADLEASNDSRSKQILCPQCKSKISIARPRNLLVDLSRSLEAAAGRMVLPSIAILGSTTAVYLSLSYGAIAVHTVLGTADFQRVFGPEVHSPGQVLRRLCGLTIVPWMLVLSRSSIADSILPIVPMLFFVTQEKPDPLVDFSSWPPSAGLSFAMLPYIRAVYNTYYEIVWGAKMRRWIEEVKPRSTVDAGRNNGELEIEIGLEDEDDDIAMPPVIPDNRPNNQDRDHANPLNPHPFVGPGHGGLAPANQANAQNGGQNAVNPGNNVQRRDYSISITRVAQSVLGALAFPGISAAVGDALRYVLPARWTSVSGSQRPSKFLQTRWGRSIIGGCLFVVLKDAVTIYVRWKMAQNHRKRKVLDYDKSKARRTGAVNS